jgi:hypothetical protein
MFVWSAFSHTTLIRGVGFTRLPNESPLVAEMQKSIKDDGLYFFPGIDWSKQPSADETAAWEERFRRGNGLLIFHPSSDAPVSGRKLLLQFFCDLLAAGIAAYLVALLAVPYWKRVLAVGALGTFGCLGVSALFWNWYGFTHAFFASHCLDKVVGWVLAGAVIAKLSTPAPAV